MKAFLAMTFLVSSAYANLCKLPKDSVVRIKSDVIFTANTSIHSINQNDGSYSGCYFSFTASPSSRVLRQGRDFSVTKVGKFHYSTECEAYLSSNDSNFRLSCDDDFTSDKFNQISKTIEIIPAAPIDF